MCSKTGSEHPSKLVVLTSDPLTAYINHTSFFMGLLEGQDSVCLKMVFYAKTKIQFLSTSGCFFKLWNHLFAPIFYVCLRQVGCMPWFWGSTSANSSVVIDSDNDSNHTMTAQPCDGARYTFLSCVVGTLTLALFLRVSWLPKMALMLLLGLLYVTVLELSGFRKTTGWGLIAQCDHRHKPHASQQQFSLFAHLQQEQKIW